MALSAIDISFKYPKSEKNIIRNFSGTFHRDKITAVEGPNGAGKSTLAKLLTGILKPDLGEITLDGEDISDFSLAQIGKNVGFVMQNPSVQLFSTSVKEEVEFGLKNIGMSDEDAENRGMEYLSYFGLCEYVDKFPYELSVGEKQRLVLASVMAMHPKYLILDEPTSALDYGRKKILGDLVLKIKKSLGTGIILISHDTAFVEEYSDDTLKMNCGEF